MLLIPQLLVRTVAFSAYCSTSIDVPVPEFSTHTVSTIRDPYFGAAVPTCCLGRTSAASIVRHSQDHKITISHSTKRNTLPCPWGNMRIQPSPSLCAVWCSGTPRSTVYVAAASDPTMSCIQCTTHTKLHSTVAAKHCKKTLVLPISTTAQSALGSATAVPGMAMTTDAGALPQELSIGRRRQILKRRDHPHVYKVRGIHEAKR